MAIWRICRCNPFSKGGYDPGREQTGSASGRSAADSYRWAKHRTSHRWPDHTLGLLNQYNNFMGLNIGNSPSYIVKESISTGSYLMILAAISIPVLSAVTQWINVNNDLVQIQLINMFVDHNLLDTSHNSTGYPVKTKTCRQCITENGQNIFTGRLLRQTV